MNHYFIFIIFCIFTNINGFYVWSFDVQGQSPSIPLLNELLKTIETDDCMISWVRDLEGNLYVVKQIKDSSPDEQFLLVIDSVACSIANQSHIPMNRIMLIPEHVSIIGKYYPDRIATIHTVVSGLSIDCCEPWKGFDIHQRFRKPGSTLWKKWGPLPTENEGLTITVIANMAKHRTLPQIVALDTFLGNADRSNPNIFYDAVTDSFSGIDMAAAFNTVLAKSACSQVLRLKNSKTHLSELEIDGLYIYYQTLKMLIKEFPLEKLLQLFDEQARQAGFRLGNPLFTEDVSARMKHHKSILEENYFYSLELLLILEQYFGAVFLVF